MIEKVLRIDGNSQYSYAKAYICLIGNDIYVNTSLNDDVTIKALVELDDNYIANMYKNGKLQSVIALLDLIRPRHQGFDYDDRWNELCNVNSDVKKAMQICEITGEDQTDVGGIKGLTISNW